MTDSCNIRLTEGTELLETGEIEKALATARSILRYRPSHPLAQNLLGLCLFAHGAFDEALELFEGLLRRNPDMVSLCFNAGFSALREDDESRATVHLQRTVALEPGHRRALALLALLSMRQGQRFVARDLLGRAGLEDLAIRAAHATEAEMVLELAVELENLAFTLPPPQGAETPRSHEGFAEIAPPGGLFSEEVSTGLADTVEVAADQIPSLPPLPVGPPDPDTTTNWPPSGAEVPWDAGEATRLLPLLVPLPPGSQYAEQSGAPTPPPMPLADPDLPAPGASPAGEFAPDSTPQPPPSAAALDGQQRKDLMGLVALDGPEVEHRLGWLLVRVGQLVEDGGGAQQGVAVRGTRQVLRLGQLKVRPSAPEGWAEAGGAPSDLVQVTGDGLVALDPGPKATLVLLHLEGEVCRVQGEALLACSGALARRMDRLEPDRGEPLPLFHLDGAGFLALRWPAPVQGFRVTPTHPLALRPRYLVAWLGPLKAQLTGEPGEGGDAMVHLSGTGLALVGASPLG